MTDQTTEPSYDEAPAAAPAVRVPNVSPGAVSGLDNTPLHGPVSFDSPVPVLPEDDDVEPFPAVPADLHNVDDLTAWVREPEDADESAARAVSVLLRERLEDKPRVTLVEPLERQVLDFILDGAVVALPEPEQTEAEDGGTHGENEPQEDGEDAQETPADPPVGEGTAEDGTAPQNDADEPGEQPGS